MGGMGTVRKGKVVGVGEARHAFAPPNGAYGRVIYKRANRLQHNPASGLPVLLVRVYRASALCGLVLFPLSQYGIAHLVDVVYLCGIGGVVFMLGHNVVVECDGVFEVGNVGGFVNMDRLGQLVKVLLKPVDNFGQLFVGIMLFVFHVGYKYKSRQTEWVTPLFADRNVMWMLFV